jgi:hypothetical protein
MPYLPGLGPSGRLPEAYPGHASPPRPQYLQLMVPETMVELLAARFTTYHSSLVAGLLRCLGLARDLPCPGLAHDLPCPGLARDIRHVFCRSHGASALYKVLTSPPFEKHSRFYKSSSSSHELDCFHSNHRDSVRTYRIEPFPQHQ